MFLSISYKMLSNFKSFLSTNTIIMNGSIFLMHEVARFVFITKIRMVKQRIEIRKYIDKVTQKYIFFIDRQSETIVCYGDIEKKGIKFISIWSSIFIYSQRRLYSPILVPDHRGLYFYLLFCYEDVYSTINKMIYFFLILIYNFILS